MESVDTPRLPGQNPIAALRRFSRPRPRREICEICAAPLFENHQHLLEPKSRAIVCACDACATLFETSHGTRYLRIPRRIEHWSDFTMSDEQWAGLGVPIALAFFLHSTTHDQTIAVYPSPAGPTEAMLAAEAWDGIVRDNPALRALDADVEALLVNRVHGARECYRAPIDECFKLVGVIRTHWRGLSGGTEVWKRIVTFFEDLKRRSIETSAHA